MSDIILPFQERYKLSCHVILQKNKYLADKQVCYFMEKVGIKPTGSTTLFHFTNSSHSKKILYESFWNLKKYVTWNIFKDLIFSTFIILEAKIDSREFFTENFSVEHHKANSKHWTWIVGIHPTHYSNSDMCRRFIVKNFLLNLMGGPQKLLVEKCLFVAPCLIILFCSHNTHD